MTDSATAIDLQLVHVDTGETIIEEDLSDVRRQHRLQLALTVVLAVNLTAVCGAITFAVLILNGH